MPRVWSQLLTSGNLPSASLSQFRGPTSNWPTQSSHSPVGETYWYTPLDKRPLLWNLDKGQHPFLATQSMWFQERIFTKSFQIQSCWAPSKRDKHGGSLLDQRGTDISPECSADTVIILWMTWGLIREVSILLWRRWAFILTFNRCLLRTHCVPGIVLNAENRVTHETKSTGEKQYTEAKKINFR